MKIRGRMAKELVDKVHNNLNPDSKKVDAVEGILEKGRASTSLHRKVDHFKAKWKNNTTISP